MRKTITKEVRKSETAAHGATAMTKKVEKKTMRKAKVEKVIAVERKGKCTYVKTTDIKVGTTVRLGNEITENKISKKFRALEKSILANGILTPIIVKKDDTDNTYTVVDGYRRLAAAQCLGIKKIQVISYDDIDNKENMLSIVANSNQKVLSVIEAGIAYKKLIDRGIYGSKRELAEALGVSESTVGAKINNLKLDKRIIEELLAGNGTQDQKVLKAIRTVETIDAEGTADKQFEVYSSIVENKLSRAQALEHIKQGREILEVNKFITETIKDKLEIKVNMDGLTKEKVQEIESLIAQIKELRLSDAA